MQPTALYAEPAAALVVLLASLVEAPAIMTHSERVAPGLAS